MCIMVVRSVHTAGLRDLNVVADKARLAQKGLYEVDGLLHIIARALADSHPPESQSGVTSAARPYSSTSLVC